MDRRYFLVSATAAAAGVHRASAAPRESIRVACAGLRDRGVDHIQNLAKQPHVELAALCDVDSAVLNRAARMVESMGRKRPALYADFRRILEDRSIDAVTIATPDHHHTLQTVWACQAGKDVYVEKPCSHTMFEARQIVEAARRYGRVVQHGTQSRSIPVCREAIDRLRDGQIGDTYMARALCFKRRGGIGRAVEEAPPSGVDYDLWMGPAPAKPFTKNRFHYNWHWQWDYGSGEIGNQAIHQLDLARWGLGVGLPTRISAMGMHSMFEDDQETPNVMTAVFEFKGPETKMLVADIRGWITNHEADIGEERLTGALPNTIGVVFYGCRGYLAVDGVDYGFRVWTGPDAAAGVSRAEMGELGIIANKLRNRLGSPAPERSGEHFANFIDAVRRHEPGALHAEIEEGATSSMLVHLANISYRLGRTLEFNPETKTCKDPEAQAMFTRPYRAGFVVPVLT